MATKRGKRSGAKPSTKVRSTKPSAKPAAKAAGTGPAKRSAAPPSSPAGRPVERRVTIPAIAPARREAAPVSLLERAKALRDVIQRSKLTAPDPWRYTPKARAWLGRAEPLLDRISANTETVEMRKAVDALAAEVEGDADFREARRLF